MKISRKDVEQVALLSRLELEENEVESYTNQLNSILEYVNMLDKLDTQNVQPTAHVLPIHNVFRKDEARPSLDRELALSNAPEPVDGFFKVPKIIEG